MNCKVCDAEGAYTWGHYYPNGLWRTLLLCRRCHDRVHDAIQVMIIVDLKNCDYVED